MKPHISFSELYTYDSCQYKHNIEYVQGLKSPPNINLIFGTCIHEAIESRKQFNKTHSWVSMCKRIIKWIKENPKDSYLGELNHKDWCSQALLIYSEIFDWLNENFPGHELIANEFELFEPIKEHDDVKFKGFIDLVIKDKSQDYHIIDFKTCSWGWDRYKRSDTKKQYQLTLYKKFFCEKQNLDPEKVKTHFVLLKRTPPKNESAVELFTISSGNKKVSNANEWMLKQVSYMKRGLKLKNRTACKFCPWYKTDHCK